jgi:hypothetical protein
MYAYLWSFVLYAVQMVLVMRRMPKVAQHATQPITPEAGEHG